MNKLSDCSIKDELLFVDKLQNEFNTNYRKERTTEKCK